MMSSDIIVYDANIAMEQAAQRASIVKQLRKSGMTKGKDYGVIPGTGKNAKPTLLKPGAEKLCSVFGLEPDFIDVSRIERFDPESPLFHYEKKCVLTHIETGKVVGRASGSCNSMESKYRWRWLWPNEVQNMDTSDMVTRKTKSGKTQYRVANDDIYSQVNTILKMAEKRALVAAVLIATNASEHFTQDIEDLPDFGEVIEAEFEEVKITNDAIKEFFEAFRTKIDGASELTDRAIFALICKEDSIGAYDIEWWNKRYNGDIDTAKKELFNAWTIYKNQQSTSALDGLDHEFDAANPVDQPALLDTDEGDLGSDHYANG